MPGTTVKVLKSGPYVIEGPVRVVDHTGAEYSLAGRKGLALCRCGQSKNRPFCDGTHGRCGFVAEETAG